MNTTSITFPPRRVEAVLWLCAVLLTLGGAGRYWQVRTAAGSGDAPRIASIRALSQAARSGRTWLVADSLRLDSTLAALAQLGARDAFAAHKRATRPEPASTAGYAALPAVPARPTLLMRGVVGSGSGIRAIVDGWPGGDGARLVSAGDTVGVFRVRRVTHDSVIIQSPDTVWHLTMGHSWR